MNKKINWDSNAIYEGKKESKKIYLKVLSYLRDIINEYNDLNLTIIEYELILGLFIERFIGHFYFSWKETLNGYKPKKLNLVPNIETLSEAYDVGVQNKWHEHLRYVVSMLLSNNLILESVLIEHKKKYSNNFLASFDNLVKILKLTAKNYFFNSKTPVLLHLPRLACGKIETISNLTRWKKFAYLGNLHNITLVIPSKDWEWRFKKVEEYKFEGTFLSLVLHLLPLYLPNEILEGLSTNREKVLKMNLKRPKVIFSSGITNSSIIGILFSEWKKKGTKLVIHQHGGGYEMKSKLAIEDFEKRNADYFLNWGMPKNKSHHLSLSPSTPKYIWRKKVYKKNILFVCNDVEEYPYELEYNPWCEANKTMHREFSIFINNLKDKNNLIIREYFRKSKWNNLSKIMKKYNNLNIDIERNIFKSYSKAKITVHMIPATTFLETMGCNIPSIIYFDISVYKFNKKTLKIFDALEKNGIYYNSAKKASFFINSLGDDIESWWFSKKVQKARNVFCAEFAYFVENWENNWSRYFQSFS